MPTSAPDASQPNVPLPAQGAEGSGTVAIDRLLQLKTIIPERPRYDPIIYRVSRGDGMWAIADEYKVKSATILFVNSQLEDNPHNLRPGMELTIPPVDGLYYQWQDGDDLDAVAAKFKAKPEDILAFPGNNIDLTDPVIKPGATIMIPGGSRELRNWEADLVTMARGANAAQAVPTPPMPAAAVRLTTVSAGLPMTIAFREIPTAPAISVSIFPRLKARTCTPQARVLLPRRRAAGTMATAT